MNTIRMPKGEVTLTDPPVELLRAIRSFLPLGAIRYVPPQEGADFGLVMKCGDRELIAVKQQSADCDEGQARTSFNAHSLLIAHSLTMYLRNGFSGLFLPCAYLRKKDNGQFESGIAYFGYPSPKGPETQIVPGEDAWDNDFGPGFTSMMLAFIRALKESSRQTGLTFARPIKPLGLYVVPALHLGQLGLGFMLVGPDIVCLKSDVAPVPDLSWIAIAETGISEVFHVPSAAAIIGENQLAIAKR